MSATTFQYLTKVPSLPRLGTFWEEDVPRNSDEFFKENFRLKRSAFNVLVDRLPNLREKDSPYRLAIPLEKQIAIALYTLGSSSDFLTIGNKLGVSKAMVCRILTKFCREVIKQLAGEYLPPDFLTQEKITETIKGFETIGFPQCFGAMDGCHIEISPKSENAVDYKNSKGWYSTILFALVDFRYRFSYISVGSPGCSHDSKIFEKSNLKRKLLESNLVKKNSKSINGVEVPILVLGDSGFRFAKNVMKPYRLSWQSTPEQKAFNYHLSRTIGRQEWTWSNPSEKFG
nr:uncharacterized protein LOC123003171 [Drosophila takahashii]